MSERQRGTPRPRVAETSAGGFVLCSDGSFRVALIGRLNRGGRIDWCVPKGHPEGDETIEQATVREIAEETGLEVSPQRLLYVAEVTAPHQTHDLNLIFLAEPVGEPRLALPGPRGGKRQKARQLTLCGPAGHPGARI